jgi:hypothetical protein
VVGNINNDTYPDIVSGNGGGESITIWLGHGDGTFAAPSSHDFGPFNSGLILDDLNADGNADIATSNANSNFPTYGQVHVRLGNGDGTFQGPQEYEFDKPAYRLTAGDFNGDNAPDLATIFGSRE